jgi:putative N6-adenine-specific DNA methylase
LTTTLFLPCAAGAEALLQTEVRAALPDANAADAEAVRGGVQVQVRRDTLNPHATLLQAAMALNLHCRLAQRVLLQLERAPYTLEDDLYELARSQRWEDWFGVAQRFRVDVSARRSPLKSLNFAALRIKDGVVDRFRVKAGARPDVDTQRPDVRIQLHLGEGEATLYLDTSGEPLFKRGWREDKGDAPLKETLAAAMLAASGWPDTLASGSALPLLDPMCGSGTIAIEAAQMAAQMAPGLLRSRGAGFGFSRLPPFRTADARADWQRLYQSARDVVRTPPVPLFAGDVSFRMTDFAQRNAERAGVGRFIDFKAADALQRMPPAPQGLMILNPPYGERIDAQGTGAGPRSPGPRQGRAYRATGEPEDQRAAPADFAAQLATHWKRHYGGWTAWVLSPDMKLPQAMRLKESRRVPLFNGPIECRLFRFDLVSGSNRPPERSTPGETPAPPPAR